jgi:hypothetical protein
MKKLIMILCTVTLLSFSPVLATGTRDDGSNTTYPEFTGNLSDPEVLIVYSGDGYVIVQKNGKTYIYYL